MKLGTLQVEEKNRFWVISPVFTIQDSHATLGETAARRNRGIEEVEAGTF